jgi:hypothetical protein
MGVNNQLDGNHSNNESDQSALSNASGDQQQMFTTPQELFSSFAFPDLPSCQPSANFNNTNDQG